MGLFEDTINKTKEIFNDASKKTGEVIEVQKMKFELSSINSQISRLYEELGMLVYNEKNGGQADDERAENIIAEIKQLKEKADEIERLIAVTKRQKICRDCSTPNPNDAHFCSNCGKEI